MIKQAIVLAAGHGQRLMPYTKDTPKCLLDIGGKTILEHQVEALTSQGIDQITIVTGYLGHKIRDLMGARANYVENTEYAETSSMYSLWLARNKVHNGFVVLNSDVLFHVGILKALLASSYPDALAVDPDAILDEEEMKVKIRGERVVGLSKAFQEADAENVGMLKFSPRGGRVLLAKIEELLQQKLRRVMVPYAVNAIAPGYPLGAVLINGLPWIEIDFPEDYERARNIIYPSILRDPLCSA